MIWKEKDGIQAMFLTREMEETFGKVRKLVDLPSEREELNALENNRLIVSRAFNHAEMELAMGKQVHGTNIAYAEKTGVHENTDGLVTDRTGVALAILVADCAALLLADRVNKVIGAAHAGWRGAVNGITSALVQKMITLGAEPDLLECYISPCISQSQFEVGEEVAAKFPDRFVDHSGPKPHVDLQGFLTSELNQCGLSDDQITTDMRCTFLGTKTLHSYRRDGDSAGRMMATIVLS